MGGIGLYAGPSEYERLVATFPLLLEGVAPADLTGDDITFLTGETSIEEQRLVFFVSAAKHACQTDLPPAVFYGLARQGFSLDLTTLLAQPLSSLRAALEKAISGIPDPIIPSNLTTPPAAHPNN